MIYPIPPRQSIGKDFCAYWDNFLSNDEINKILAMQEWFNVNDASVGGSSNSYEINKQIRETQVAWLGLNQENAWLWEKISNVVADVNNQFFKFDLTGFYEPMQLGAYKESNLGHYDWHTDAGMNDKFVPRKLSMSLLLSHPSEFEGGELQVKTCNNQEQTLGMIKGRAWFFPSYMLHRVTPVTKGIRRSLVLWIGGPEFK